MKNQILFNPNSITISPCLFQEKKGGAWQTGLSLDNGNLGMLTMDGRIVKNIWNWNFSMVNVEEMKTLMARFEKILDYLKTYFTPVGFYDYDVVVKTIEEIAIEYVA